MSPSGPALALGITAKPCVFFGVGQALLLRRILLVFLLSAEAPPCSWPQEGLLQSVEQYWQQLAALHSLEQQLVAEKVFLEMPA